MPAVSIEELFGETWKRGLAPRRLQQIESIAQLSKSQQRFVKQMLDTLLMHAASR